MKIKEEHQIKIRFPLREYVRQIFFSHTYVTLIDPFKFWRRYRIDHLENCWEYNLVRHLERCWQQECNPEKPQQDNDFLLVGRYRGIPWQKQNRHEILVSQPSFKLKYRGVTYCTSGIVALNPTKFEAVVHKTTPNHSARIPIDAGSNDNPETSTNASPPK